LAEILIDHLLNELPSLISYSPISIPITSAAQDTITLIRRDLFDARFQLIAQSDEDEDGVGPVNAQDTDSPLAFNKKALDFLDAPSDLVPGVYEGGLKTWECSLDLVEYLHELQCSSNFGGFSGKRVLEIGCGTAMPSLYILHQLFSSSYQGSDQARLSTQIHLQDYNTSVLQLVTLPNILLIWYASPLSMSYRSSINNLEIAPTLDITVPGELPITPELKAAFLSSLLALNVTIRFFSGSWNTFDPASTISPDCYNVILTSETIYQTDSLESLVDLMQAACTGKTEASSLGDQISSLNISEQSAEEVTFEAPYGPYQCLVATKVLYFGVGGGVLEFLKLVERRKGRAKTVQERKVGVGRRIIRVEWVHG